MRYVYAVSAVEAVVADRPMTAILNPCKVWPYGCPLG